MGLLTGSITLHKGRETQMYVPMHRMTRALCSVTILAVAVFGSFQFWSLQVKDFGFWRLLLFLQGVLSLNTYSFRIRNMPTIQVRFKNQTQRGLPLLTASQCFATEPSRNTSHAAPSVPHVSQIRPPDHLPPRK